MRRPLLLLTAALACDPVTGPGRTRVLGEIAGYYADDPHVDVPATAERGRPFSVSIRTYGNACRTAGNTGVRVDGLTADVTPYDYMVTKAVCADVLLTFVHTATLRFDAAGLARVRVRGLGRPGGTEIVVEREVVVR